MYTYRHDSVFKYLPPSLGQDKPEDITIYGDLKGYINGTTIPTSVKISAQLDIPKKSYCCFKISGQIYIVKMAVFDQFYRHRKEWSYRDFKDLFGNGMAVGTKWEHVESLVLTLV